MDFNSKVLILLAASLQSLPDMGLNCDATQRNGLILVLPPKFHYNGGVKLVSGSEETVEVPWSAILRSVGSNPFVGLGDLSEPVILTFEVYSMDQALMDVFEQARKVVADADRKIAEEEERRRESEREKLLLELGTRVEEAFDFTSKEKLELEPRSDVHDGVAAVEFMVRKVRAIFLLSPAEEESWTLRVLEDGLKSQTLGEIQGGTKNEQGSRRLAAARIVTMIGNWAQNAKAPQVVTSIKLPTRRQEPDDSKPERTYGTMGKFLGVSS